MKHIKQMIFCILTLSLNVFSQTDVSNCQKSVGALRSDPSFSYDFSTKVVDTIRLSIDWIKLSQQHPLISQSAETMLNKMSRVDVKANWGNPAFCSTDRKSEFYLYGEFKALFNSEWLNMGEFTTGSVAESEIQRARVFLGLHILIGAAGYYDENYERTLGLVILSTFYPNENLSLKKSHPVPDFPEMIEVVKEIFEKSTERGQTIYLSDVGGSSGVSGGGDLQSLWLKLSLIENDSVYRLIDSQCKEQSELKIICQLWPAKKDYIRFLFSSNIESSAHLNHVEIDVSLLKNKIHKIRTPKLSIRVMMAMGSYNKLQIIDAIIKHIARSAHEK